MKTMLLKVFLLVAFAATTARSFTGDVSRENVVTESKESKNVLAWESIGGRSKRQTETTTTPKPKKHRPANIFSLISELITETRQDTSRAFNEIGTLFNSQFADSQNTMQNKEHKTEPSTTTTTAIPPSSPSSDSESDDENEITTTTEQYRITRDEFLGILRSNIQGISQLFRKEFRVAIQDSNQNVREFGRDLGTALRPYFN